MGAIRGVHPDPQLDGLHERPDEREPTRLAGVERLGHEEQRPACTQLAQRAQRALEEEKRIFEGHVFVEEGGAGPQHHDQSDAV